MGITAYRDVETGDPIKPYSRLADSLCQLSFLLLKSAGRKSYALEAEEEAIAIYKKLAVKKADPFVFKLVESLLSDKSLLLLGLNRKADALGAIEEAMTVHLKAGISKNDPDFAELLSRSSTCLDAAPRLCRNRFSDTQHLLSSNRKVKWQT